MCEKEKYYGEFHGMGPRGKFYRRKFFLFVPLALAGMAVFVFLGSWVTMLLWNVLMPSLFHLPAISWVQALGLLILARLLFGGHGSGSRIWQHRRRKEIRDRWRFMREQEKSDREPDSEE